MRGRYFAMAAPATAAGPTRTPHYKNKIAGRHARQHRQNSVAADAGGGRETRINIMYEYTVYRVTIFLDSERIRECVLFICCDA